MGQSQTWIGVVWYLREPKSAREIMIRRRRLLKTKFPVLADRKRLSRSVFLKLAALGAVLITACGASSSVSNQDGNNGNGGVVIQATSTVEVQPTNTTELKATATSTEKPTATPTRDPDFKEWPASWFAQNFAIAQKGDPNVSMTTVPCVYSDELCVQAIDYCPEGTECVGYLVVSPRNSFIDPGNAVFAQPGVRIGSKYYVTLWGGFETFTPQGLYVTDDERDVFLCTIG